MTVRTRPSLTVGLASLLLAGACQRTTDELDPSTVSLYALVSTVDGTYFYPPLGPTPSPTGAFDATLAGRLRVVLESQPASGGDYTLVAAADAQSTPRLVLLSEHDLYFANFQATTYFTDPSRAYRFRLLLDGAEIGRSDMTSRVFEVMALYPNLMVGFKARIERRPAPAITALAPVSVLVGSGNVTVTVSGSGFVGDSVVRVGSQTYPTRLATAGDALLADLPATLFASAGDVAITVFTPPSGGGTSAPAHLAVLDVPTISALTPSTAPVAQGPFTLTIDGAHFGAGAQASFGGNPLATTVVTSSRVTAVVPAALLTSSGVLPVTLTNPTGGVTPPAMFTIAAATCTDGVQNGGESSVDCGGGCGTPLPVYRDADGDGFGAPSSGMLGCTVPAGYTLVGGDCDDTNGAIHPGAAEVCNGLDDDCSGQVDENACVCNAMAGYWKFEEGYGSYVRDNQSAKDGFANGAPTWTSGRIGGGMSFNGSSYVEVPPSDSLDPHTSSFTVEAWAMIPAGQRGQRRIVAHGTHGGRWSGYALMQWCPNWGTIPCGGMGFLVGVDNGGEYLVGTCAAMDDGRWHHYAGVMRRDSTMELWVDGARVTSPCGGTSSGAAWAGGQLGNVSHLASTDIHSPCALCVGGSCQNAGACNTFVEPWTGTVDEVGLWMRGLTAAEIQDHYASGGAHVSCAYPRPRAEVCDGSDNDLDAQIDDGVCTCSNLGGYWRLDEGSGSYARDTEYGHDGMLVSSATWRSGKLGTNAMTFNGTGYVKVPDHVALDPHTGDFSVEAWVQIPAGQRGQRRIVAHGSHGGGGHDGYSLMQWCAWGSVPCGGMGFILGADGRGEYLLGTCSAMDDGNWHHYAGVVRRSGLMELYVDGARVTSPCSGASSGAWSGGQVGNISHLASEDLDCPCAMCLGTSCQVSGACTGTSEPFTGSLDEVAYWNRALSASEVAGHYNGGAGRRACGQ